MGACIQSESKNNNAENTEQSNDEFITKLYRQQISDCIIDTVTSDKRRIVFISLIGVYQTWHLCPIHKMMTAIFVLPFKKKWIHDPHKYQNEINQTIVGNMSIFQDKIAFDQFICLLKWKDSQNLLFCTLDFDDNNQIDECKENEISDLIAPFWKKLSKTLTKLYDPITKSKYNPIQLNVEWWKFMYDTSSLCKAQYDMSADKTLCELYSTTGTINFKSMQEIIYQSNPKALKPVIAYNSYSSANLNMHNNISGIENNFVCVKKNKTDAYGFISFGHNCCPDIGINSSDNDDGVWMISIDYNEYDK